jgi:phosphopantothenoylcysteine decarboxylase/phosphopantothenate--cysteine ligase
LKNKGAGFKYNTNQISILDKQNKIVNFKLKHKDEVAIDIADFLVNLMIKNK